MPFYSGLRAALLFSLTIPFLQNGALAQAGAFVETGASDQTANAPAGPSGYTVQTGTHIPLGLINSVSTKHSVAGDRIYLETVFPIVIDSHIVIPPGSYVMGTV